MTSLRGITGLKVGKAITSNLVATLRNMNIVLVSVGLFYTTLVTSITLCKFRGSCHEEFCSLVRWWLVYPQDNANRVSCGSWRFLSNAPSCTGSDAYKESTVTSTSALGLWWCEWCHVHLVWLTVCFAVNLLLSLTVNEWMHSTHTQIYSL